LAVEIDLKGNRVYKIAPQFNLSSSAASPFFGKFMRLATRLLPLR
jgi:hypothetical protein